MDITTKTDILRWIERGIKQDSDYLIVACDTFSYENFPVFCKAEELQGKYTEYSSSSKMLSVMEVYNLREDIPSQINQRRCFSLPEGFSR